ncbi:serine/threonine-protein kinase [Streptomyces sp. NPDC059909]|uniref:serine/threonine-protein kinase n=1 Tax=Streptomyces sp. NPDC059909 TaxID=3346998 RepID=UPI0036626397
MSSQQPGGNGVFKPLEPDDPQTVAGYRLAARLGAGGMGKVYLSYTPGGRPVAIKVIRPDFSEDPEFRRRFAQEVQAAQRVQGLYTAPVIDADTDGAQPWLATAYVPGPSLAEAVVAHGALPVEAILLLVAGIAEALHVIHGAGIVHRDLKPSNVLLAADGPRVIDFGIARAADATSLTSSGVTIGTPSFMAPEQAAGSRVTPATDIFALGQVAAYASTGAPAFGEGTSHGVLYRIVHEEPDLSGVPERLRELVTRCLAKDPEARPSIAEIIRICQAANAETVLRRPEDWLPGAVAADITGRAAAPAPASVTGGAPPVPSAPPAAYSPTTPVPPSTPPPGFGPAPAAPHQTPAPPQQSPASAYQTPPPGYRTPPPVHQTPPPAHAYAPTQTGYAPVPPQPPQPFVPGPQGGQGPSDRTGKKVALAIVGVLVFGLLASCTALIATLGDNTKGSQGQGSTSSGGSGTGGSTGTGAPSGGARTPKADPPVEYNGIDLTEDYLLSLADDPVRPRQSDGELEYDTGALSTSNGASLILLQGGQQGSLETCRSETRYTQYISREKISAGAQLCLLTSSGNVGLLTVKGFSPESDPSSYIKLDLTVWRKALEVDTSS